jgi:hypothetical protein
MTRATIVLDLESNTPLFAIIRDGPYQQGRAERICESSPYEGAGDACEYCINGETDGCLGRGIACLELHLWRQRDEQSTYSTDSPDFTIDVAVPSSWTEQMSLRAMDVSIKNNKCISIVPATLLSPEYNTVNCVQFLFHMSNDNVAFKEMMCGLPRNLEGGDASVA